MRAVVVAGPDSARVEALLGVLAAAAQRSERPTECVARRYPAAHVGVVWCPDAHDLLVDVDDDRCVVLDGWMRHHTGETPSSVAAAAAAADSFRSSELEGLLTVVEGASCAFYTDSTSVVPAFVAEVAPETFAWSTELSALLPLLHRPRLDRTAAIAALVTESTRSPWSLVEGIEQCAAGHRYDAVGRLTSGRWYRRRVDPMTARAMSPVEVRRLVGDALSLRLDGSRDPAILLSAGLDSMLLATIARRDLDLRLASYTFRYDDTDRPWNEYRIAASRAEILGIDHHVLDVRDHDMAAAFDRLVRAYEAPIATGLHSAGVHLVADRGHDALVSGFEVEEYFDRCTTSLVRLGLCAAPSAHLARMSLAVGRRQHSRLVAPLRRLYEFSSIGTRTRSAPGATLDALFGDRLLPTMETLAARFRLDLAADRSSSLRDRVAFAEDDTWWSASGPYWIHRWTRSAGMSARLPLEDTRLEHYLARHCRRGNDRQVFRRVLDDALGSPLAVDKYGQRAPVDEWMRGELGDVVGGLIMTSDGMGVWNPDAARQLLTDHREGRCQMGTLLVSMGSLVAFEAALLA